MLMEGILRENSREVPRFFLKKTLDFEILKKSSFHEIFFKWMGEIRRRYFKRLLGESSE